MLPSCVVLTESSFPTTIRAVHDSSHARLQIEIVRNTVEQRSIAPALAMENRMHAFKNAAFQVSDLQLILYLYCMMSNYSCKKGQAGHVDVDYFSHTLNCLHKTLTTSQHQGIVEEWTEKML